MADLGFVHRFVPGASPSVGRTLLLLHGTGGNEDDLIDLGHALAPGANLLSPRGKVLEGAMPRFFRRLAEGVFDLEDLKFRTRELAGFVASAAETYGFDPAQVMAAGYSNGANIAASLLLQEPTVLEGAFLFHAMVPFVPDALPDIAGKPVFLSAGRADPIVRPENTQHLADLLSKAGAEVFLHWQPGGHQLSRDEFEAAQKWISGRLKEKT